MVLTTGQDQLGLPPQFPVLLAGEKLAAGDFPAFWSESYPGLQTVHRDWKLALKLHRENLLASEDNSLTIFCNLLASISRLSTWLHLFASLPIGSHIDWLERSEFHKRQARLRGLSAPVDRIMEVLHRYRLAPQPTCLPAGEDRRQLIMTHVMWAQLAVEAQDQLSASLDRTSMEDRDDEFEADVEMTDAYKTTRVSSTVSARLWPVLITGMVLALRCDRLKNPIKEPCYIWNYADSKEVLIELGLSLGALCRPRLLQLICESSESSEGKSNEFESLTDRLQNRLTLIPQHFANLSSSINELNNQTGLVRVS